MSNDRIAGMIWGFNIGTSVMLAVSEHPAWLLWSIGAFLASHWFAKHPEYNR